MDRLKLEHAIRRPTTAQIKSLAHSQYMDLSDDEAADMGTLLDATLRSIEELDEFPVPKAAIKYSTRKRGARPSSDEDPYNAFIRRCHVEGSPTGKLIGKTVGLKDNIRLAGIPMTNASRLMEDYVPSVDATAAERLLDAGATIVGKTNMDKLSMGGTSETGDYGSVRNPHNPDFSAGGSSGGSGAAVAAGYVDIALGVDQAGSARIPASWCGIVSMKATHGLVPSFGITYVDHTIDFVCPMARTVRDTALALEAIAGEDWQDPQWIRGPVRTSDYALALEGSIEGLRVGVIRESFEWSDADEDVNQAVRIAVSRFETQGAKVTEISIPWWQPSRSILSGILCHTNSAMVESDLEGYWRKGLCDPGWQDAFGKARRTGSNCFPPLLKVHMILGKYLRENYCSTYFSKAQNARVAITDNLTQLLNGFDVLVTPTVPMKAVKLTENPRSGSWSGRGAVDCNKNCCQLNLTGHPALTLPCGIGDSNLPIGIQLIGQYWDESTLFRAAAKIELMHLTSP